MADHRTQWIDMVKGFGILCIVIAHITQGVLREVLFLFHVPLFFFLSGYLFKSPVNTKAFVVKKANTLLKPYGCFLLLFLALLLSKDYLIHTEINFSLLKNALIGGQALTGELSVFWFITSLFLTQITFAYINSKVRGKVLASLMGLSLILAYITAATIQYQVYIWAVNTLLYTLPIFYLGYVYASLNKPYLVLSTLCVISLSVIYYVEPSLFYIDIKSASYGIPFFSFLFSIAICILIFFIAKKTTVFPFVVKGLSLMGVMSMTIMYMHQPIQITLKHSLGLQSSVMLVIATLVISMLTHYSFNYFGVARKCFLGKAA